MLQGSLALGRIAGIDVRPHSTWLLAVALIAWSTALGWFPTSAPGFDPAIYGLLGVSAALLFFVSVLLHELAHCVVARDRGQQVLNITRVLFGEPSRPGRQMCWLRSRSASQ